MTIDVGNLNDLFLGLDIGTSGVRAIVIDAVGCPVDSAARTLPAPEQADDGARRAPRKLAYCAGEPRRT